MDIILDNDKKKILASDTYIKKNGIEYTTTNTVTLFNMGAHASHRYLGVFDKAPEIWATTEISMLDTRDDKSSEMKAEFLYYAMDSCTDNYRVLRVMISSRNDEERIEEKRVIFYDEAGKITYDTVYVSSFDKISLVDYGIDYQLDTQTGSYINDDNEVYEGNIANNLIFDRVNRLASDAEKQVDEKSLVMH